MFGRQWIRSDPLSYSRYASMSVLVPLHLVLPVSVRTDRYRSQRRGASALPFLYRPSISERANAKHFHQGWSDCVSFGDFSSYRDRFEKIQTYFAPRFPEAIRVGNQMIKTILEKTERSN